MNKKLVYKLGFSLLLLAILAVGFASVSSAAKLGLIGCPTTSCPTTSGYTYVGSCTNNYGHGCVEQCTKWRAPNGSLCKTNCNWW